LPEPTSKPDPNLYCADSCKYNKGKTDWFNLLQGFAPELDLLAQLTEFGAAKYSPHGWQKSTKPDAYLSAAMRHLMQHLSGETIDNDSKLPHLTAAAWNILAYQHLLGKTNV